jgi:hypothetical protein
VNWAGIATADGGSYAQNRSGGAELYDAGVLTLHRDFGVLLIAARVQPD